MVRHRGLPFQLLMTLCIGALMLMLTAAFLWYVLERVQERVEQSGRESFGLLARDAFDDVDALRQSHLQFLGTAAQWLPTSDQLFSEKGSSALALSFRQYSNADVLTVVEPDDSMLYFLRHDPEAPAASAYTMGRFRKLGNGDGWIDASYHAANHSVIARRQIPIRLSPTTTEAYQGVLRSGSFYIGAAHPVPGRESFNITLAAKAGDRVVSLSTPLDLIDRQLVKVDLSANGAAVLVDDQQRVVGLRATGPFWHGLDINATRLRSLAVLDNPVLAAAHQAAGRLAQDEVSLVDLAGEPFLLAWHDLPKVPGIQYRLLLLAPLEDLSQIAKGAQWDAWVVVLAALVIILPLSWWGAGAMARVLQSLVRDSERIGRMDFAVSHPPLRSPVREVQALGAAHAAMRGALAERTRSLERVSMQLERLVEIGIDMGEQKDRKSLIDAVFNAARKMTGAQMGILFLRDEDNMLRPVETMGLCDASRLPVFDLTQLEQGRQSLAVCTVQRGTTLTVQDLATDMREELFYTRSYAEVSGIEIKSAASLLLRTHDQPVVGVMQVFNAIDPDSGEVAPFTAAQLSYLEALASQVAVALERHKLVVSQERLLDTMVRTLGDAIDAKSEYTGRHCARVPELAMMLAVEAHNASSGPLADFAFRTEDQWREFRTGAWLHDCGKITTPEHVLDKATKLEIVYNRLHEIRTRFEVLMRDVRIEALQAQRDGRMDAAAAAQFCAERERALHEDYAFIANCNIGGEHLSAEDIARVRRIAQQPWLRHFDDRLGLSIFERALRPAEASEALPVAEPLLADQPWHRIPRSAEQRHMLTEGFSMDVPEFLYDHGEVYNLCLERGTLTREERFKVNEHIIHTLRMLEGAQFPPHLRRVPEYAGTHHEAMDGSGYPRGLKAEQLSIPARIMAIADIFEALTAADRPYKAPKPLSESLRMLHQLKRKGHIDADLFDLFLRSGVYLRYAQRFLRPAQMDVSDIGPYLD